MNWEEARAAVNGGKTVFFHHKGKVVPVDRDTQFTDLQWHHFKLHLTWNDILKGTYSADVVQDAIK